MITLHDLKNSSNEFFDIHWPVNMIRPKWSEPWHFIGEIPNNELQGCYALMKDDNIIYIGVGAGRGSGIYIGAGLGSRLHKYWKRHSHKPILDDGTRQYEPSSDFKNKITSIVTIGFQNYSYLAYALEIFLISKLNPINNKIGTS